MAAISFRKGAGTVMSTAWMHDTDATARSSEKRASSIFRSGISATEATGYRRERSYIPALLSAMDVFVFPSLYEGMPLSVLEVQANGLPCVISTGVPKDVYLTDLIHPLALADDKKDWIDRILSVQRENPQDYASQLKKAGFDLGGAMDKIYDIYEGTKNEG